jgi:putative chitinase
MTLALTFPVLNRLWPHAPHSLVEGMVDTSATVFEKYGLTTKAEVIDFLAQVSVECGAGTATEENLNYTAERLCEVWPSRFKSIGAAGPFAHNPKALADNVYGGRMGNRPDSDDGWDFRGRGTIQITGREMYEKVGVAMGLDLISNPDLVNDPKHFLEAGAAFWRMSGLNAYADRGDFRGETLRINGGTTGLDQRQAWRARWQAEASQLEIADEHASSPAPVRPQAVVQAASPEVPEKAALPDVTTNGGLQQALVALGYPISIDGGYGTQTRQAVTSFQMHAGIVADGTAGKETEAALTRALQAQHANG